MVKFPLVYPFAWRDPNRGRFIDTWIELTRGGGTIDELCLHWIRRETASRRGRCWSVTRTVFFAEQRMQGTIAIWTGPFVKLRRPMLCGGTACRVDFSNQHLGFGCEGVDNPDIPQQLVLLEIFSQQIAAVGCMGSGYDQGVPP